MDKPIVWLIGGDDVRLRLPLVFALRARGLEVGVVGSEGGDLFAKHGVPYWRYSLERGVSPWADRRSRRELYFLFREHKPHLVHAFDTKPVILAPLAAKEAGVRGTVCTITGLGYVYSSTSPLRLALRAPFLYLNRRALSLTGVTVFQNEEDRQYFLEKRIVERGRDALIRGSGVDVEQLNAEVRGGEARGRVRGELGLEGRPVVTMVARLAVNKGVREYLDAARQVRRQVRDAAFLLVGPVAAEGRRAVPVKELEKSAENVRYLGERTDVAAVLAASDLFVLPSYNREGVPRVLLEAGAMGLPLIASDMPGCRDVVRDGWNGLLVPPRDPKALSSAILRMLACPEDEKSRMGSRSKAHVMENFSLAHVADAYSEIYRRVLAS